MAAPIWKDGIPNTEVVAVATIQPADVLLNNIMTSLKISENSIAYMIDQNGTTIADVTPETVNNENVEELAKTNKDFVELAAIHEKMRAGKLVLLHVW